MHKLVKSAYVASKCSGRCSCKVNNLPCTELCKCEAAEGSCNNLPTDEIDSEDGPMIYTVEQGYLCGYFFGGDLIILFSNRHGCMLHLLRIYKQINLFNWNQPLSVFDELFVENGWVGLSFASLSKY